MKTYRQWKKIAKKIAGFQADVILFLIFFIVLCPLSLLFRKLSKNNSFKEQNVRTYWVKRKKTVHDITWARLQ